MSLTIEFPLPLSAEYGSNARGHFMSRAQFARKAREDGWALAVEQKVQGATLTVPCLLRATFYCRADRDADNCLTAAKPYIDGVAQAFGVNDRGINPIVVTRVYEKARRGRVVLTFEEAG